MQPVQVPAIKEGMDARLLAAQALGATDKANNRLKGSRRWYEQVRQCYEQPADAACTAQPGAAQ